MKKRILIVDDDADIAEALAILLSGHYVVDTATDGSDAADKVRAIPYHAVVLDLMMPIMDGAGFKRFLSSQHIDIPVLLMSASANLPDRAAEIGVDDFIAKPLDLDLFERRLATLLSRRAA